MKKFSRMLGVTLLEVMLVLAVAAMIILMSVKFYKSAQDSNQVNAYMESVQAITAAADGIAQNSGSYSSINTSSISAIVGSNNMAAPWGTTLTVAGSAQQIVITPGANCGTSVYTQVKAKLESNPKYSVASGCAVTYKTTL